MSLRVIKGGILDTVQDMGRIGYQHLGINPGGAMDKYAAQIANILVGNDSTEGVIELHFPSSSFIFEQPALIALSGADFKASINGEEVPTLHPLLLDKYSILQFHAIKNGARAYIAVHGGFEIEKWLGSYSTHIKVEKGGVNGRALKSDDEIAIRRKSKLPFIKHEDEFYVLPWKADTNWGDPFEKHIAILAGHEWNRLTDEAKKKFHCGSLSITRRSDRMGYRLKGDPVQVITNEEVVSSAVGFGTIQLLPDGQLIVLMADHQTTGGYPRLAHVITAHHSRMAQMKPGDSVSFKLTDQQTAEKLYLKQQQHLAQLRNACTFKLEQFLKP
ncbi:MAG TPA: biotin-dependent carboxyltransferase family protein [Chitinophagaceae bacterium]